MNRKSRVVRRSGRRALAAAALLAGAIAAIGCDRDRITAYDAPPDPPQPAAVARPTPSGGATPSLAWTIPADWRPAAQPPRFVLAAYDAGPADAPALVTVSRLGGDGGGALPNINRWRRQLNLTPIADLAEQPMTRIDVGADVAAIVDLAADQKRTVAIMLPRPNHDETWFFKMTGPPKTVETHKQALLDMVRAAKPADPNPQTTPTATESGE